MRRETAETERENRPDRSGSDARSSVGKHASGWLRSESGEPQMQRAASSQQAASPAVGKRRKESGASRVAERKARNGKAAKRSRNRQVEGKGRKAGTNRLTGPGRQQRWTDDESRFLTEPPSSQRGLSDGPQGPERSSRSALSGMAIAQVGRKPWQASVGLVATPAPFAFQPRTNRLASSTCVDQRNWPTGRSSFSTNPASTSNCESRAQLEGLQLM